MRPFFPALPERGRDHREMGYITQRSERYGDVEDA